MRTTIKDVAKAVGLSTTTVSLVLNKKSNRIPQITRDAVLKAAKDLNYRPNHIAVSMVTKKTHIIGLILPDISNLYFSELAKIIQEECHQYGYNILYGNTNGSVEHDFEYLNLFLDYGADAIILSLSSFYSEDDKNRLYDIVNKDNIPILMVDRALEDTRFKATLVDQKLGGCLATNYLIKLGHERIGCITGPKGLSVSTARLEGYKCALLEAGMPFDESLIYEGDFQASSGANALTYLLGQNATAAFCLNDMMAIGLYRECHRYHLSVPENFSIVGFDDIFMDEFLEPPLTTIAQPVREIGTQVVKRIMSILSNNPSQSTDSVVFNPVLKIRGSAMKLK